MDSPASPESMGRISPLVFLAFGATLLSVGGCALASIAAMVVTPAAGVVILALPLVSLLGAILGAVCVRRIDRSGGAEAGRGLAVAALIIGSIAAVLQGAVALSALGSYWSVRSGLVPVVRTFVAAHERGDITAARAMLGESASKSLTDERAAWFFDRIRASNGPIRGARFDLAVMMRASSRVRAAVGSAPTGASVTQNPKPIELECQRGNVLVLVMPDDQAMLTQHRVVIADMLVLFESGQTLPLLADGPGRDLAAILGVKALEPERATNP